MLANEIEIGLRVKVSLNGLNALVVGRPEYYNPRSKLIRIKYENSTRYEYVINQQIDALPKKEQYKALGGEYIRPENSF